MSNRVYYVIDMKSFFASVECAERGLDAMKAKLVVADASRTEKTICLAVSPALKAMGVKNRCRLFQIPKNIDFIIAKPRMKKYIEYAANIYAIYLKYIDKKDIHVYSIDECIIDVTDYLKLYKTRAKPFALKLINEINEKYHIPATCGIGSNMYLAKIALGITAKKAKDRIGWLTEEKFKAELWNHRPLSDFWGISRGIESHLARLYIYDMEGISKADPEMLYKEFGVNAELLIDHSNGIETATMADVKSYQNKSKSISSSQILPKGYNYNDALLVLKEMVVEGCYNLARSGYVTTIISLGVGYEDHGGAHASTKISLATNLYSFISKEITKLFEKCVDKNRLVRRIGFGFGGLLPAEKEQYDLFTDLSKVEKEKKLRDSIIMLKDKYGKNSVLKGMDFEENATARERNKQIGGHNSE